MIMNNLIKMALIVNREELLKISLIKILKY